MFSCIQDPLAYKIIPYLDETDISNLFTVSKSIRTCLINRIIVTHKINIGTEHELLHLLELIRSRFNIYSNKKEKFPHRFNLIMLYNTFNVPSYYKYLYDKLVTDIYIMYKMDHPLPKYIKRLGFDYTSDSLVKDLTDYNQLESLHIDISFREKINLPKNIKYLKVVSTNYLGEDKAYIHYLIPPSVLELDVSCCPSFILFDSSVDYNINILKIGFRKVKITDNVKINKLYFPSKIFLYLDTETLDDYINWINTLNTNELAYYESRFGYYINSNSRFRIVGNKLYKNNYN